MIYDRHGDLGCQAFLIVETEQKTHSTSISDWEDAAFVPELGFLREIDGRPGREVVVKLGAGASTELYGLFTWQEGGPRRGCLMLSVLEPPPPGQGAAVGVRVRGRDVSVRFKRYGAVSARVIIGYGTRQALMKTVTGGRARFRLPFRPETAGHLIVLLKDDSGAVVTAAGVALKAGNLTNYWP